MVKLITTQNLSQPDDFYAELLENHNDLSTEDSHALNARLVLLLCNHIGDHEVLQQALAAARQSGGHSDLPSTASRQ
ncbi:MAG: DUF2783 domain-containing protein [Pseudoprimorskyibacter sp.]|jgi:hypothetical protein|nr:DUF2783 domain-containing protein [Pseudoprimorskyibacter sp.]